MLVHQVRLKAMCILEALLRQGGSSDVFQKVTGRFEDDSGSIIECSRSPQASLKEKSKKVPYPVNFEGGWTFFNGCSASKLWYKANRLLAFKLEKIHGLWSPGPSYLLLSKSKL